MTALSAVTAFSALACEDPGVKPTTTVQAADSADQVLEGFSHYVTNEGILRSRVEADTAFFYEATQITELHKVKVVFFDVKAPKALRLPRAGEPTAGRTDPWRQRATW